VPFRHHGKVVKVFLELFILPRGENYRDTVPMLINNVAGSPAALNCNLLSPLYGVQEPSISVHFGGGGLQPGQSPGYYPVVLRQGRYG